MKMNTTIKVMIGAGITAAMYQVLPQIKNMITNKMNNASSMSSTSNNMSNMSSTSSGNENNSLR